MRRDRTIDGIEGEVGEDLAGDNSFQSVRSGDAAERDELEQILSMRLLSASSEERSNELGDSKPV